jgi:predicted phosphohydrolase
MRLVCISDTHNSHRSLHLPEGDVLIHAGDATGQGLSTEIEHFLNWFAAQPHPHKILVAGNHDWLFQRNPALAAELIARHPGLTYLQDAGVEIEGIRFWGSPWQPWFMDWSFNLPRGGAAIREKWNRIPIDTDVLITHGPPHGVLDQVHGQPSLGCEELRIRLAAVKPRVHVFGHIHDSYGTARGRDTVYINACVCGEDYRCTNRPIVVELGKTSVEVHGIEANLRLERLEALRGMAPHPGAGPSHVPVEISEEMIESIREMAEIRSLQPEELLHAYLRRGLEVDIAKHLRSEKRPGRRAIPYRLLDGSD